MKPHDQANTSSRKDNAVVACLLISLSVIPAPAFAQIAKLQSTMDKIVSVLTGVGVAIFTIALLWVGFKMAFQHAKWAEVSNIVIGAFIVGGASGIANWLIN